jgi:hypothetical protein
MISADFGPNRPKPAQTGPNRPKPAQTGLPGLQTGRNRPFRPIKRHFFSLPTCPAVLPSKTGLLSAGPRPVPWVATHKRPFLGPGGSETGIRRPEGAESRFSPKTVIYAQTGRNPEKVPKTMKSGRKAEILENRVSAQNRPFNRPNSRSQTGLPRGPKPASPDPCPGPPNLTFCAEILTPVLGVPEMVVSDP